ncbi:MAG: hypothetical protein GX962_02180 [Epulopiscium sp.]|nr:hypothetical protein [Candidatus Epulonipiscium sp.]
MQDFFTLMIQILAIAAFQVILEGILEQWGKSQITKLTNIACYLGSLYVLWQFFENHLLKDFQSFFRMFP